MRNYYDPQQNNKHGEQPLFAKDLAKKVSAELIRHVYSQTFLGMFASTFCATIVFIGLYAESNKILFLWFIFFLSITLLRVALGLFYKRETFPEKRLKFWESSFVIGAVLGGLSWGFVGTLLFPEATELQKTLIVLMLAGVTAGSVPLSSAVPLAAISFLVLSLTPLIINILLLKNYIYLIFDAALAIYLCYMIVLTINAYKLVKKSIFLRFENDVLLESLYDAKDQLELTNKMLAQAATHDPLTQVANRNLFQLNLEKAIMRAKKNNSLLALLYIDLDRFKFVNDIYGHHIGDQLLIVIVNRLKTFFRSNEAIARLGGDELTIILENIESVEQLNQIADQLCKLIARPFRINNIGLKISASIGISLYPRDGDDARELLWYADKSMYYVKERGGNNYHFTEEVVQVND